MIHRHSCEIRVHVVARIHHDLVLQEAEQRLSLRDLIRLQAGNQIAQIQQIVHVRVCVEVECQGQTACVFKVEIVCRCDIQLCRKLKLISALYHCDV